IEADANVAFGTHFLRYIGIPTLSTRVRAEAIQTRRFVEVVMALDISASMDGLDAVTGTAKLIEMRAAAKDFVSKILTSETLDVTSVTLVPFGGTVNPGDFSSYISMDASRLPTWPATSPIGHSLCPEFERSDFTGSDIDAIDFTRNYTISQQFKRWNNFPGPHTGEVRWGWCPEPDAGIVAHTNVLGDIETRIDSMGLYDGTGIDMALKWSLFALSPESRSLVNTMISDGIVDNNFAGRPMDYGDDGVEKYIVFLTDGGITEQKKFVDELWDGTVEDLEDSDIFASDADRDSAISHIESVVGEDGRLADYWSAPNEEYKNNVIVDDEIWDNIMHSRGGNVTYDAATTSNVRLTNTQVNRWSMREALEHATELCDYMRAPAADGNERIRVFTIGFNINGWDESYEPFTSLDDDGFAHGNNLHRSAYVLNHCPTNPADLYLVNSDSLGGAFDDIAAQINSLRLTAAADRVDD
ncbi:MAG: hypothetical protein AAFV59_18200, partial [Pseudomonadota bacterium]